MRVEIRGTETEVVTALAGTLRSTGRYIVGPTRPAFTVTIDPSRSGRIEIDGVDSPIEGEMANFISELSPDGAVLLDRGGRNRDDRAVTVRVPNDDKYRHAVESGVFRALERLHNPRVKKPDYVRWVLVALLAATLLALGVSIASAQNEVAVINTSANANAVAVRCVNAAGNTFESCAGAGGGVGGPTDIEDDVVAAGQTLPPVIDMSYWYNSDMGWWNRTSDINPMPVRANVNGTVTVAFSSVATGNSTLGSLNAAVTMDITGTQTVGLYIQPGTLAGVISFEGSTDNFVWEPITFIRHDQTYALRHVSTITVANPNEAVYGTFMVAAPFKYVRAIITTYTSGSTFGMIQGTSAQSPFADNLAAALDGGFAPKAVIIGGGLNSTTPHAFQSRNAAPAGADWGLVVREAATAFGITQSGTNNDVDATVTNAPDTLTTGNITGTACPGVGCVSVTLGAGEANVLAYASGTYVATLIFEATIDDSVWVNITGYDTSAFGESGGPSASNMYIVPVGGFAKFRVRASAYTSGTANVSLSKTNGSNAIRILPGLIDDVVAELSSIASDTPALATIVTNTATINTTLGTIKTDTASVVTNTTPLLNSAAGGYVRQDAGATMAKESGGNLATLASAVRAEDSISADADKGITTFARRTAAPGDTSGTNGDYEALQMNAGRLWASATIDAALPAGNANIGDVDVVTLPTVILNTTGCNNCVKLSDGTNTFTVKAASTAAVTTDTSVVVSLSPNNGLPTGSNTIGALTANQTVDVNRIAGTATATAAAGVQKVGIVGNANAALDAANNAAMPANAVATGMQTATIDTSPTAATAGNLRYQLASTEGVIYVQEGGPKRFSCFVQAVTATTQCQAAPAAGLRAYITSVSLSNEAATVQTLDIVFGTGAACVTGITALTHKWQFGTVATTTSPFVVSASFPTPLVPTAANAICVRPSAATAFGATITGYIAP